MPTLRMRPVVIAVAMPFAVLAAWLAVRVVQVFRLELDSARPSPHAVPLPSDAAQLHLVAVEFASRDGSRLRGWYLPSRNRAAVVVVHGSDADRRSMLPDARILNAASFGVLLFDWPGHGESEGAVTWGRSERAALAGAIDFVQRRPDVDSMGIGALGFSLGAYVLVQVAARDPRIRSVAIAATPTDLPEQTEYEYAHSNAVARAAARLALRWSHVDLVHERPIDRVASIAPRPLLVITSAEDPVVAPSMGRALFRAAGAPKRLLVVPGGRHGGYAGVSSEYAGVLAAWFDTLLETPATVTTYR